MYPIRSCSEPGSRPQHPVADQPAIGGDQPTGCSSEIPAARQAPRTARAGNSRRSDAATLPPTPARAQLDRRRRPPPRTVRTAGARCGNLGDTTEFADRRRSSAAWRESFSYACTRPRVFSNRLVSMPSPGPISRTRSSAVMPEARTLSPAAPASVRKFCDSGFRVFALAGATSFPARSGWTRWDSEGCRLTHHVRVLQLGGECPPRLGLRVFAELVEQIGEFGDGARLAAVGGGAPPGFGSDRIAAP